MNMKGSELVAVLGNVDPDAYAAGTYTSGWVSAAEYDRFLAIVQVGDIATSGTVDAKLQQASDSSGTGAKDITDKAITQLTEAGTDSNKQAVINLKPTELDMDNDFTHFRLSITTATAAADASGIILGIAPLHGPASDNDVSTVDEIVA